MNGKKTASEEKKETDNRGDDGRAHGEVARDEKASGEAVNEAAGGQASRRRRRRKADRQAGEKARKKERRKEIESEIARLGRIAGEL